MAQTKPHISIVNVASSVTIDQELDLVEIVKKFPGVEYDHDQFPGAVFRLNNPRTAILIFRSGKMVCTGTISEELSIKAVNRVVQKLKRAKIKIKNKPCITIQNIVSSINLGGIISLEQAARTILEASMSQNNFLELFIECLNLKRISDFCIRQINLCWSKTGRRDT